VPVSFAAQRSHGANRRFENRASRAEYRVAALQSSQRRQPCYSRKMSRYPPNSRPPPRFDPRKPQSLTDVLGRTDAFQALRAGVEQVTRLQRDLTELLPDYLGANVEPGFIKDGVLALFAGHNALAARLRHVEPRLLADLQQRGWPVESLKIRVRPQAMKETVPPKQARMSAAGADALQTLAETLEPSPLQEALAKMAARHQAKAQKK
jgi:hypothetical protein